MHVKYNELSLEEITTLINDTPNGKDYTVLGVERVLTDTMRWTYKLKHKSCGNIFTILIKDWNRGNRCPNKECIQSKKKATYLKHYGKEYYFQTDEFKTKNREYCQQKYHTDCASQAESVRLLMREASSKRTAQEQINIQKKINCTTLKKYGTNWITQSKHFKEKTKETHLKNHGVDHYSKTAEFKTKLSNSWKNKSSDELETIKSLKRETSMKHYNVFHPMQSTIIKNQIKQVNLLKYGSEWYLGTEQCLEKTKNTNLLRYGYENILQVPFIKEQIKQTNIQKYGIAYPMTLQIYKDIGRAKFIETHGCAHYSQLHYPDIIKPITHDVSYLLKLTSTAKSYDDLITMFTEEWASVINRYLSNINKSFDPPRTYCVSYGNLNIKEYLVENDILFSDEYRIAECKNIRPLIFDFVIFNSDMTIRYLIEYNGIQHYEPVDHFGGIDRFKTQQLHDKIKREFCVANNIPLIVIKYDETILNKLSELF